MDISEIRIRNLQLLIEQTGKLVTVANRSDTAPSYLSQIINGSPTKAGNPRKLGDKLARKLESGMGKPHGWMDAPHFEIQSADVDDDIISSEFLYLKEHFDSLSIDQKRRIVDTVRENVELNTLKPK